MQPKYGHKVHTDNHEWWRWWCGHVDLTSKRERLLNQDHEQSRLSDFYVYAFGEAPDFYYHCTIWSAEELNCLDGQSSCV